MLRRLTALGFVIAVWAVLAASAQASFLQTQISAHQVAVNHMRRVMHNPAMQYAIEAANQGWVAVSPQHDLARQLTAWKRTEKVIRYIYRQVPNKSAWLCIHHYEGAWNDPNSPYFGGLQMDLGFQGTYGRYLLGLRGTANHWTPLEQMWTAEYARAHGRGFYPWPNTARYCHLL